MVPHLPKINPGYGPPPKDIQPRVGCNLQVITQFGSKHLHVSLKKIKAYLPEVWENMEADCWYHQVSQYENKRKQEKYTISHRNFDEQWAPKIWIQCGSWSFSIDHVASTSSFDADLTWPFAVCSIDQDLRSESCWSISVWMWSTPLFQTISANNMIISIIFFLQ